MLRSIQRTRVLRVKGRVEGQDLFDAAIELRRLSMCSLHTTARIVACIGPWCDLGRNLKQSYIRPCRILQVFVPCGTGTQLHFRGLWSPPT